RLLRSVDTSTPRGLRDYAILLMMSIYGFGAGEVIRLQLQDIDWDAATIRVVRPKTGVAFTLPLAGRGQSARALPPRSPGTEHTHQARGHQNVLGTEVYLKATPELLELASDRFEQHVRSARLPQ